MFSLQPEGVYELNVSNPEVGDGTPNMDGNIAGLKGDGKGYQWFCCQNAV